jgi:hypothetical protein
MKMNQIEMMVKKIYGLNIRNNITFDVSVEDMESGDLYGIVYQLLKEYISNDLNINLSEITDV